MKAVGASSVRPYRFEDLPFLAIWTAWALTSTLSLIVAIGVVGLAVSALNLNEDRAMAPILFSTWFVLMVASQTWMLSRRLRRVRWWPVACAAGWLSLFPIVWLVQQLPVNDQTAVTTATTLLIVGVTLGLAQGWALRGQWRRAGWWPVVSAASGVLLALIVGPTITSIFELILLGVIPGAVTGPLVAWLFVDLRPRVA